MLLFCFTACEKEDPDLISLEDIQIDEDKDVVSESIFVYVCGAVNAEGVYQLPAGSRCHEAIAMAGGFSEDAATTSINQAEILQDEITIYVPTYQELMEDSNADDGKININTASKEELMKLPGVGEAKAAMIIQFREENGRFQQIEDIMKISGIKEGMFAKIKDFIKV